MPPPMKLSKAMIEAFGGSDHYQVRSYVKPTIAIIFALHSIVTLFSFTNEAHVYNRNSERNATPLS